MNENWIKQKIEYLSSKIRQLEKGGGGGGSTPDPYKMDKVNPIGIGSFSMGRKKNSTIGRNSHTEGGFANSLTNVKCTYVSQKDKIVELNISVYYEQYTVEGSYLEYNSKYYQILADDSNKKIIGVYNYDNEDFSSLNNTPLSFYKYGNEASGYSSHAEGCITRATSNGSHAEGLNTLASGAYSHAEGSATVSNGHYSHAEGAYTTSSGLYSHAQNYYTTASGEAQTVVGKYNKTDTSKAFIIGNGTSTSEKSNALEVDWEGNVLAKSFNGLEISSGEIPTGNGVTFNLAEGGTYVYFTNCWDSSGAVQANGFTVVTVPKGTKFSSTTPKTYPTGTFTGTTTSLANSGVIKIVRQYSDYTARYVLVRVA